MMPKPCQQVPVGTVARHLTEYLSPRFASRRWRPFDNKSVKRTDDCVSECQIGR